MTQQQITEALAAITLAMPIILAALHGARAITTRLRVYALTTPQAWDDEATARVLAVLDGLDALVDAVSTVIPGPPKRQGSTPSLERVESGDEPEDLQ